MTLRQLLLLQGLLGLLAGCGDATRNPAGPDAGGTASGGSTAGAGRNPVGAAGADETGSGGSDGEGGQAGDASGVMVQLVDVPSGPCSLTTAEPRIFMEPEPSMLAFDRAGPVDKRRFAFDSSSLALLTFDADGAAASPIIRADVAAVTGFGGSVVTLELGDEGELTAKSYDEFMVAAPDSLELDGAGTGGHALAASTNQVIAVWDSDGELRGQLFTPGQAQGTPFDFGPFSCGQGGCASFALWTGERFVVLWSREASSGQSVLSWAAITASGDVLSSRNVLSAQWPFRLAGATQLADQRVAVLLTEGAPALAPLLLFLDRFGAPQPTLRRFIGATEAWAIASHDADLALVARSEDSQAVFRALNGDGEPEADWTCLDDSGPDTAFEPRAAVFSDGSGYAAVVRQTDGSAAYLALDSVGNARP